MGHPILAGASPAMAPIPGGLAANIRAGPRHRLSTALPSHTSYLWTTSPRDDSRAVVQGEPPPRTA